MSNNISKYVQLNDFILLEYEFCRNGNDNEKNLTKLNSEVFYTVNGGVQYIDAAFQAETNNTYGFTSIPMDAMNSTWLYGESFNTLAPSIYKRTSVNGVYNFDKIKIHVVSGYQFQDSDGFLVRVRGFNNNGGMSTLANFTWTKNIPDQYKKQLFFNPSPITISNKRYDKYILLEVPSMYDLGLDINKSNEGFLANLLDIKQLSDIVIDFGIIPYGMISSLNSSTYILDENITTSFPVTSVSDNFNCFIKESSSGDYIEYYATWMGHIIGKYMNEIETGVIPLYTSNNPNEGYEEFNDTWGQVARKWIILHDLEIIEHIGNNSSLVSQRISLTQDNNYDYPNYYRPIILNSDIASSVTIIYTCRLQNRMDGSQIVRKSSFNLPYPRKYGKQLSRISVNNMFNYKVNNVIDKNEVIQNVSNKNITKINKVYYDTTKVILDVDNNVYEQGLGMVYIKDGGSVIKFNFSRIMNDDSKQNVDLSGMHTYRLRFPLSDGSYVDVLTSNSKNMNMALGQLEFIINDLDTKKILSNDNINKIFLIQIINTDNSYYTFYQGKFLPLSNK